MKNQTALVTGAGSGIGQAIAKALAADGARVFLTGRNAKKLTDTATLCGSGAVCRTAIHVFEHSGQDYHVRDFSPIGYLELVQPASLADSWSKCGGIVEILEHYRCYLNLNPHFEPQLGRGGLYSHLGSYSAGQLDQAALWVLNLSDGMHSLLDVAERSGLPFNLIRRAAEALLRCELLAPIREGEWP